MPPTETKLGWKVVYHCGIGLFSAVRTSAYVEYFPNEWVSPHCDCGPLCLFGTRREARSFAADCVKIFGGSRAYRVFRCEYVPSRRRCDWCKVSQLPHGTILAERVKLLPRVRETGKN
jgi:hypothetical protein